MQVRALLRAVKVETAQAPYDTIHLRVYYPAKSSGNEQESNFGILPPNTEKAPFPVVILFNGANCSPEGYQWLAVELAQRGLVVLTFSWVAENIAGMVSLTPGVNFELWSPDQYGTAPTASALPALVQELERLQSDTMLAGLLDLQTVVIGGHSAGGRVAIESASQNFFPNLAGAFSYGAHTGAPVQLGYEAGTILPLPDSLPLLLLGGTHDGVIAQSSHYYGSQWQDSATPVLRTFQEGVSGGRGDTYLILLEGANHFSMTDLDQSPFARVSLDYPATKPDTEFRTLMAQLIGLFIEGQICKQQTALLQLQELSHSNHPLIHQMEWK